MKRTRRRLIAARLCRVMSAACLLVTAALSVALVLATEAVAGVQLGTATVVTPASADATSRSPLTSGTGETAFSLALPAGAACSGDSAHAEYRVQSFLVPVTTDLGSLTFDARGPMPAGAGRSFRQPLFEVNSRAYVNAVTEVAADGGPGVIINVPAFDLRLFSVTDLPAGRYVVGIACTKGSAGRSQLDHVWSTAFEVATLDGRLTWTAPASAPDADTSTDPTAAPSTSSSAPVTDAPGALDASAATTTPAEAATTARPTSTGGTPSLALPATELVSHLTVADNHTASLVLWLVLTAVFARLTVLLVREPTVLTARVS